MRKVLILCYYFPPCNGAPSWRPYSWVLNFHKHGFKPLIITRHWNGSENTWEDFLLPNTNSPELVHHENYDVLYLPSKRYKLNDIITSNKILRTLFGNIYFFILGSLGRFNTEVDVYLAFKDHLKSHLRENKYDAVVISSPPSNILELIKVVKRNSNAVIIADFRDLWNNMMLTVPYKPTFKQKIWDFFYSSYYVKWLKEVDLITVIIQPFAEILGKLSKAPIEVVYNGYESSIFEQLRKVEQSRFTFSVVGNIYPEQDLSVLFDGLRLFLKGKSSKDISIRFIGAASLPAVGKKIQDAVPSDFLYLSDRVAKQEALQETLNAHVLSFCGWKGVRGMISTKAFDYIASGNYVLIAPGDGDALDKLIADCQCGSSVNTAEEFHSTLEELFAIWKKNGSLPKYGDQEKIEFYSREHQAEKMAGLIEKSILNKQKS